MPQHKQHVLDVDENSFEAEVMNFSAQVPVVIDLWAPWCGPCKVLGPILEDLAETYAGAFRLAKVDVDKNPSLASAFRAQSIPMVVAIYQGQFVDQFMGALPKQDIARWLDGVFTKIGLDPSPKEATGPVVPADPIEALAYWKQRLAQAPEEPAAKLALGKLLFSTGGDIDEAEAILRSIPATAEEYNQAQGALKLKGLLVEVGEAGGEAAARASLNANPDDVDASYHVALADGVGGHYADALAVLVSQVERGNAEQRARAKSSAGVLFEAAGRGNEVVETLRKKLARLLF